MKTSLLAATAAAAAAAAPVAPPPAVPAPQSQSLVNGVPVADTSRRQARIAGFAPRLSQQPVIDGRRGWTVVPPAQSWAALARANPDTRQEARWRFALSLIGRGRGADAFGVLEVMRQDETDLALVDSFRLARGAALAQMGRSVEAMEELIGPGLVANPEACAWRMLTLAEAGLAEQALGQLACAQAALSGRQRPERARFVRAAARSALAVGQPGKAVAWLGQVPKGDVAADLLRGRALAALGKDQDARAHLARVEKNGSYEQKLDARLAGIEAAVRRREMPVEAAIKQLEQIRYVWRGGEIEERALRLSYELSVAARDLRGMLSAGATLFHYFDMGAEGPAFAAGLQQKLAAALDPENGLPLDQALGLYWDFRELAPLGAEGDLLVSQLAGRLQAEGLYDRAADLLEHQLFARARDLAQGPLSARVATLHILAGHPQRALIALRKTGGVAFPSEMRWDRQRVEAVALAQLGKTEEALAVLQGVPNGGALRAEILWKKRDWSALAEATRPALPAANRMSEVNQAIVLRYAIALAMTGREDDLAALRARYAGAFAPLPTAGAFDALTSPVGTVDPEKVSAAMGAIPSASPAGQIADLFDVRPASRAG
ncbi:hypothetical protein [Sphingosinicella sp. LY1275]|uniref:hypothetical protein n=1 Tax=Sphingosinicella sp. LY1275 TaxID=3095379 RepID=UPI002ADEBC38|nr:hypothetical protein [Sphingosinicella sp. LY1275]MEA1013964.1 hypothetical protein [Sphingosinicella sp. LY1275]